MLPPPNAELLTHLGKFWDGLCIDVGLVGRVEPDLVVLVLVCSFVPN